MKTFDQNRMTNKILNSLIMYQLKQIKILLIAIFFSVSGYSQSVIKIQNGTTVSFSSNVIFTISNLDLDNDGTFYPAAGQGRVVFAGNANNLIKGNGTTGFDQLEIAKTGNGYLLLEKDFDIRSGIWFTSGKIELNNHTITLLGNALLNNESENSRITGLKGGFVQVAMQLNNPQSVNPGNLGTIISSSENLGLTTIRRGHAPQSIAPGQNSIYRFYDILPANNNALDATLRFEYLNSELNNQMESALTFHRSSDQQVWTNEGMTSRNETDNYVELQGVNSFSRWTLAGVGSALPVQFIKFTVKCENGGALVTWTTAQEFNSDFFEVQSSMNGTNWQTIGTIAAAGYSSTVKNYSFTDTEATGKLYRIKQVDLDGSLQYTKLVMADCAGTIDWSIWPNPVSTNVAITMNVKEISMALISIYDSRGRMVKRQSHALVTGNNQVQIDLKDLASGIYHVEMSYNNGIRKTAKIVKK